MCVFPIFWPFHLLFHFTPFCRPSVMHVPEIFVYFSLKTSAALKLPSSELALVFWSPYLCRKEGETPASPLHSFITKTTKNHKTIPQESFGSVFRQRKVRGESYALGITKCSVENFSKENVQVEPKKLENKAYSALPGYHISIWSRNTGR